MNKDTTEPRGRTVRSWLGKLIIGDEVKAKSQEARQAEVIGSSPEPQDQNGHETLAMVIASAIKEKGYPDTKSGARGMGLGYELLRTVLRHGHIPRDRTLLEYAEKLGVDTGRLIRLAHYERAPEEARQYLSDLLEG